MIRTMNANRMEAIVELVKLILQGDITVLAIDRRFFRHNVRRLRFIATPNISLDRKRRTLLGKSELVTRLLRDQHLARTMLHFLQGDED